jgi:hypothetical protein
VIAKLKGLVDSVDTDSAVIDVGGVGYLVSASARTLRDLSVGGAATMLVETIVREDAIALYGFLETGERDWFRILTTVQGVGARVALSILSTLSPDEIARGRAKARRAPRHGAEGQGGRVRHSPRACDGRQAWCGGEHARIDQRGRGLRPGKSRLQARRGLRRRRPRHPAARSRGPA